MVTRTYCWPVELQNLLRFLICGCAGACHQSEELSQVQVIRLGQLVALHSLCWTAQQNARHVWEWVCLLYMRMRGVVGNAFRLKRSYSTPGPVSTAMGDCLRAGKQTISVRSLPARSTEPSTLRGTVKWVVTDLYGLRKVGTLVQLTGVA